MFVSAFSSTPFRDRLKILAVNEAQRYPALPNLPTVAETVPGFDKLPTWYAFFGPAGMQRPIQMRLNGEMNKALNSADMKEYLEKNVFIPVGGTPEELHASLVKGIETYGKAVKLAGLKPE
jgi:tripartite-type tricarboxylate transporter receptor subunit TctC